MMFRKAPTRFFARRPDWLVKAQLHYNLQVMTLGALLFISDPRFTVLLLLATWGAGFFLALRLHRKTKARLSRAGWLLAFAVFCMGFILSMNLFHLLDQAILGGWLTGLFAILFATNFALAYLYGIASVARSVDAQDDTRLALWAAFPVGNLKLLIAPATGTARLSPPSLRATGFVILALLAFGAIVPLNALRSDGLPDAYASSEEMVAAHLDALGIEGTLQLMAKGITPSAVSNGVRRTHATAEGNVLTRWFTVDRALLPEEVRAYQRALHDKVCGSSQVGVLLARDAVFRDHYRVVGEDLHYNLTVGRADCGS